MDPGEDSEGLVAPRRTRPDLTTPSPAQDDSTQFMRRVRGVGGCRNEKETDRRRLIWNVCLNRMPFGRMG